METKRCTKCGNIKPLKEFWAMKSSKDGLQDKCKDCFREYAKSHREQSNKSNRERNKRKRELDPSYIEYNRMKCREYYSRHKDKENKRCKTYYETHKQERKNQYIAWCKNNKQRRVELRRDYYQSNKAKEVTRAYFYRYKMGKQNIPDMVYALKYSQIVLMQEAKKTKEELCDERQEL